MLSARASDDGQLSPRLALLQQLTAGSGGKEMRFLPKRLVAGRIVVVLVERRHGRQPALPQSKVLLFLLAELLAHDRLRTTKVGVVEVVERRRQSFVEQGFVLRRTPLWLDVPGWVVGSVERVLIGRFAGR